MTRTISRWNFGSTSPFNHRVLNFPHRMHKAKKTLKGTWDGSLRKSVAPWGAELGPRNLEPSEIRFFFFFSQQCEKTALARQAHNSKLIFHIRRLVIRAVALPFPLPLLQNLWPSQALWPELPGNSGKERKQCGVEDVSYEVTALLRTSNSKPCAGKYYIYEGIIMRVCAFVMHCVRESQCRHYR